MKRLEALIDACAKTGSGPLSNQAPAGTIGRGTIFRIDSYFPLSEASDSGALMGVKKRCSPGRKRNTVEPDQEFIGNRGRIDPAGKTKGCPVTVYVSVYIGRPDLPTPDCGAVTAGA